MGYWRDDQISLAMRNDQWQWGCSWSVPGNSQCRAALCLRPGSGHSADRKISYFYYFLLLGNPLSRLSKRNWKMFLKARKLRPFNAVTILSASFFLSCLPWAVSPPHPSSSPYLCLCPSLSLITCPPPALSLYLVFSICFSLSPRFSFSLWPLPLEKPGS